MLLAALIAITTLLPRIDDGLSAARAEVEAWGHSLSAIAPVDAMPRFLPETRAVSNWRAQAGETLRPMSLALVARYAAGEPAFVARCVKLNNYWCIKTARWSGEIGADAEGHTGFATAADGADAAAQLLRRYYRDYGRRTALGIVRRWAPSECRAAGGMPASATRVSPGVAPHGLGGTLRARFLARHTRAGLKRPPTTRREGLRVQPWSPLARLAGRRPARIAAPSPAPKSTLLVQPSEILVKPSVVVARPSTLLIEPSPTLGSRKGAEAPARPRRQASAAARPKASERAGADSTTLAAAAAILASMPLLTLNTLSAPAPLCSGDAVRIRNYAARIAASVGLTVDDDLTLFGSDGRPTPNLRAVMLAMSGVELGTLRAGPALVDAAIARLDAGTLAALGSPAPTP